MERLPHCYQGFIAKFMLTLKSELLYVFPQFSRQALRSQRSLGERTNFPIRPLLADRP
jgi:hypothetical protein